PLLLKPGTPHPTDTKLIVPLTVFKDNRPVDLIHLATSTHSRRQAAEHLSRHFGDLDPDEAQRVFSAILADALERTERGDGPAGPLLRALVKDQVTQRLRFKCRNDDGTIYSASLGRNFSRADFLAYHPDPLLEAVAGAVDAPRGRLQLVKAVVLELGILWPTFMALPRPDAAELDEEDMAALRARFHAGVLRIWEPPSPNQPEAS